ncbi:MAG TPA: hypothetical protein VGB74_22010 [Actinoplanes sp.]|jgi:hypothetical protein
MTAVGTAYRRQGTLLVGVLTLSAFGPYLLSGLRTEQVAVYAAVLTLAVAAKWTTVRATHLGMVIVALLGFELLLAAIGAALPPENTTRYPLGSALAGLDNLLLPIAVLMIVWMVLGGGAERLRLIAVVCWCTVWAMVVNAGLATWATGGGPNLSSFQGQEGAKTVAARAEQLGRYSGIFNQPAEAGLMYSVALLAAIYLYRHRPLTLAVTATAITVGGILAVSKVFLLVGMPVGLWQILRVTGGRGRRFSAMMCTAVVVLGGISSGMAPEWAGAKVLLRLLPGSDGEIVALYTAGRLGDDSTLAVVTEAVLHGSPMVGYGAGGLQVAYDNGWIEALVVGGVVGAVLFTAVLLTLATAWWKARRRAENPESTCLAGGLVAVVVGGAVGIPSLTVNRCSTVVWLLLALLVLSEDARPRVIVGRDRRESSRFPTGRWRLPDHARLPGPRTGADPR